MTNQKMKLYLDTHPTQSLQNRYMYQITLKELRAFVGLMIFIGVFRASREPVRDLYSDDLNFGRPILRATMPRERFKTILRFLRFDDQATRVERALIDNLAPIRYVFETINSFFYSAYNPGKYITLDEHLCRYRGRCKFLQYMPNKPDKYGIKCWVIADARNFYPLNVEAYSGKNGVLSNRVADVAMRMVSKVKAGHIIVGDNYFTSLSLTNRLFDERNLFYLGTIAKNRTFIPKCLANVKDIPIHSSNFYFNGRNTLVSYIRSKNKNVLLLSNIHPNPEISSTIKKKPQMILDYNINRSGVDKLDQMVKEYRPYRATRRWPCVLFFDLIAFATQAAWVLYCLKFPDCHICKTKNKKRFLYRLGIELVTPLILLRKASPGFRYFTNDVKEMIHSITNQVNKDNPVGISHITDSTSNTFVTPQVVQSEVMSETSDIGVCIAAEIPVESTETSEPGTCISADLHAESAEISEPGGRLITEKPVAVASTETPVDITSPKSHLPRTGRCNFCGRLADKKTKKRCEMCFSFICPSHYKIIYLCPNCEDNVALT